MSFLCTKKDHVHFTYFVFIYFTNYKFFCDKCPIFFCCFQTHLLSFAHIPLQFCPKIWMDGIKENITMYTVTQFTVHEHISAPRTKIRHVESKTRQRGGRYPVLLPGKLRQNFTLVIPQYMQSVYIYNLFQQKISVLTITYIWASIQFE